MKQLQQILTANNPQTPLETALCSNQLGLALKLAIMEDNVAIVGDLFALNFLEADTKSHALYLAISCKARSVVPLLLNLGVSTNLVSQRDNNQGCTALHYAFRCYANNTDIIELLITHGAKPFTNANRQMPLLCLDQKRLNTAQIIYLIERYHAFEAEYMGYDPDVYKECLLRFYAINNGSFFNQKVPILTAINTFWNTLQSQTGKTENYPAFLLANNTPF